MTEPLKPPPKKNPQRRTRAPTRPSHFRSRAALGLAAAAGEGRFMLQVCDRCTAIQYPPRDACSACLSIDLSWKDAKPTGTLIAETTVQTSTNTYFRERSPWRVGTVVMDTGPSVIAHIHGDITVGEHVRLVNRLDRSGQAVFFAMPVHGTDNPEDDLQMREMTCDPKFRRVLITDGRNPNSVAIAEAFVKAGASIIFVGESEAWRPYPNQSALRGVDNVEILPLDVTDTNSVQVLSGEISGKTDILVNNARFIRPGGLFDRRDVVFAQQEIEVNYLGLMRLAQSFGPVMRERAADGTNSAVAWVNILSAYAWTNEPDFGPFSASNAAALSISQALRADLADSGIRVMNVYVGPTEDEWHQPLPPPKVTPGSLARAVVTGLRDGLEEQFVGDIAEDLIKRWRDNPKVLEREMIANRGRA